MRPEKLWHPVYMHSLRHAASADNRTSSYGSSFLYIDGLQYFTVFDTRDYI